MRHGLLALVVAGFVVGCAEERTEEPTAASDLEAISLAPPSSEMDFGDLNSRMIDPEDFEQTESYGLGGHYNDYADEDDWDALERDRRRGEIDEAQDRVRMAQGDLNSAVRSLRYGDWEGDLSRVERRLRDLDDAVSGLEAVDSGDPSVGMLRSDVDRMRRETRRLYYDNWREVVPDLERRNRDIESSTYSLEEPESDW